MKVSSKFVTGIVSKLISKTVHKKFGHKIDIKINEVTVKVIDEKTYVHLDVDGQLSKDELLKILKNQI